MALFQHPHLTRGIVHTPVGAFAVNRGIVDLPDDVGESLGWTPVAAGTQSAGTAGRMQSQPAAPEAQRIPLR